MKVNLNEPINVETFQLFWKEDLLILSSSVFDAFVKNMKQLNKADDTYAEWIKTWLAWNELSSDEDINRTYGGGLGSEYMEIDDP